MDLHFSFLESCTELMQAVDLDGLDYDWEFPGWLQRASLAVLLRRTSAVLRNLNASRSEPVELSVALPGPFTFAIGFSVNVITRYCDFVNLMTYDLVLLNPLIPRAALHSPLYAQPSWIYAPFAVDFVVAFWLMLGLPRTMINLGIPTYGVAYALQNKCQTDLFSPIKGYSPMGANINYATICTVVGSEHRKARRDQTSGGPFVDDGNGTWISYDDEYSITQKVAFARSKGLGGIMIFSLNADDHLGDCGRQRFPLTRMAVRSWLNKTLPAATIAGN
ncbi:chitinase-3 protein 2-like [Tropilaelaps mercedesae]|uniref:Chitinase-3 protein 2-like n=1 Tax=Tropilaelaps mercedesae TaxID=418985 RepID=A0A1V9XRH0_9ACAR|nr:chitinase-3 protein 2-like [Tropilaelaps mercedesae]